MNPFTALFSTTSKGRAGRVRLILERLEARDLPSGVTLMPNAGAQQSPQIVTNTFINNGDGTDTVRFFGYNSANRTISPDYVTVGGDLPADSKGGFVYADYRFGGQQASVANPDNVLWGALAEKAYAQLAEEGWSVHDP